MKQKKQFSILKQKSYLTAGVITLTAVIAMAGIYYKDKSGKDNAEKEAIVMAETEKTEEQQDYTVPEEETEQKEETEEGTAEDNTEDTEPEETKTEEKVSKKAPEDTAEKEQTEPTAVFSEPQMHFSAADRIGWPVSGDVVLNYSMDQSVYFATLDQYKYNPAVIIQGAVNDKVTAAAEGQVISVDSNAETGLTVTMGLGDGYQAIYGQLKEVDLEAGDYVSRGDTVGFISEPTKYYSVEGSNLYFAMTKNGNPVNPMDYFE